MYILVNISKCLRARGHQILSLSSVACSQTLCTAAAHICNLLYLNYSVESYSN